MDQHEHRAGRDRRTPTPTVTAAAPVPDRVRMPLLTLITQQSLDEDYQHAADRRTAGAPLPPRGRQLRVATVVVMVFGVLAATAFVQTNRNADVDSASRATLIDRIESASDQRALLEKRVAAYRTRVAQLERGVRRLTDQQQALALTERRLQVGTGFIAVRGEGVRVTVTQAPDADDAQEVKDLDLRLLVNGLFEAGAEAVAVNGQRMSSTTAIRTSGVAIAVNFVGVAPPYVVEAIGDTRTLAARFADSTTGQVFASNAASYGFTYDVDNVDDLRLPAAPASRQVLRSAREKTADDQTYQRGGTTQ
ncbi:DUF881 domain-containing protein [Nocardioides plantarum]|uniref:DUF881 domain-containing protein n=1 Tax=Nocardioides plantarum TaxID=29299 RepID=A0ABV5K628_9ACTN|nr:DUF881 domain-containing protein [Nocardioides plantarum]